MQDRCLNMVGRESNQKLSEKQDFYDWVVQEITQESNSPL